MLLRTMIAAILAGSSLSMCGIDAASTTQASTSYPAPPTALEEVARAAAEEEVGSEAEQHVAKQ
jgi:hypothetical protein